MYLEELDRDTSSLPKEQEPKDVTSIEDANISGILEESQVNKSIHKSSDTITSEEIRAHAKDDDDACTSKEASTSEEKKDIIPPKTTAEVFQNHRLVFHDVNAVRSFNDNKPFSSCLLPLCQNESSYESIHVEMCSAFLFIFMQIKLIFM